MKQYGNQKGFGMVMMLLALVVAGLLYLCVAKRYLMSPTQKLDRDTQKVMESQGMKARSMPDTVQQAQTALDKANEVLQQKDRDAQTLLSGGQQAGEAQRQ